MEKNAGLWIDHEKAFLVTLSGTKETRALLFSDVEPKTKLHGGSRSVAGHGSGEIVSENKVQRKRIGHLKSWYKEVILAVGDADRIFIFGPGTAKLELLQEMGGHRELSNKVVGMEPAGDMTENQMAAKVKGFFGADGRGVPPYRKPPGA